MISLTLKSAACARSKSSKRITAAHLKQAVLADPQFDFLQDIVSKVPDAPTAAKESGAGAPSKKEEEAEAGSADEYGAVEAVKGKRKRAPGGGRKRGKAAVAQAMGSDED